MPKSVAISHENLGHHIWMRYFPLSELFPTKSPASGLECLPSAKIGNDREEATSITEPEIHTEEAHHGQAQQMTYNFSWRHIHGVNRDQPVIRIPGG